MIFKRSFEILTKSEVEIEEELWFKVFDRLMLQFETILLAQQASRLYDWLTATMAIETAH